MATLVTRNNSSPSDDVLIFRKYRFVGKTICFLVFENDLDLINRNVRDSLCIDPREAQKMSKGNNPVKAVADLRGAMAGSFLPPWRFPLY